MVKLNTTRRSEALALKLTGLSYKAVALRLGISAGRVQQLLRPPKEIVAMVKARANGQCEQCGIEIARGDIHHRAAWGSTPDTYETVQDLMYLCATCHRQAHAGDAVQRGLKPTLVRENLALRVPPGLVDKLKALADARKESLNATCAAILAHYVSKYAQKEGQ